ncbi:hypothetical protein MNBD_GAMMA01-2320 [hydrothermal vent metagenome]|uniref:Coenzyme Q-binding protein COQ10 START domain-containing protein n=1 Tax=hydrothermal vent metagenome TaxID=652676 RepID=A0A3B0VFN8_9ZZZZ
MLCRILDLIIPNHMHQVNRQAIVPHNARKMFELVNSVTTYPQFLKWCDDSHVIDETKEMMIAGMTISLAGIRQKFTTKNIFIYVQNDFRINLTLVKGPFDKLSGYWLFTHLTAQASKIELHLEFNFKSGILNTAFKRAFGKIAQQLVADFVTRSNQIYL